jgi:Protein of unknown function (DUF3095)
MNAKAIESDSFYGSVPIFCGFQSLMDPAHYRPLPDDWIVGAADVIQSTKAIAENRYKAVNMAGAAIIASVTNALGGREFPFAFGGDGASLAVSARDREAARGALAATASWTTRELGLTLRVAMVPMREVRSHGVDVSVARYAVSEHLSYAMFSGGGIAWADAAMKRGDYAISPAPPNTWPNLTGLSCRFREIGSARGVILSVLVSPAPDADPAAFRKIAEEIVALTELSPDAGRPVPAGGPGFTWPSPGAELEARTAKGDRRLRRIKVLVETFFAYLIMRSGIRVGSFVPATYLRQVVENSDFRKYDDGLRMVIDCTSDLADQIERRLAAVAGTALYGLHRQEHAIMTCFTQSSLRGDHVHFIDGAQGGYTAAATALKAATTRPEVKKCL